MISHVLLFSHKEAVIDILFWLHNLLDQPQCCAQWQANDIVVGALDAFNQYRACRLYAVAASFVVAIARPYVCEDDFV
jgi:hypothetical protein